MKALKVVLKVLAVILLVVIGVVITVATCDPSFLFDILPFERDGVKKDE